MAGTTIGEALKRSSSVLRQYRTDSPRLEAEILLSHLLKKNRLQLLLDREQGLSPAVVRAFFGMVRRRCSGEPLAYITGNKYFFGLCFAVNRYVLIPRPETELIMEAALGWVDSIAPGDKLQINAIDLGTGSGALAVTLAFMLPKGSAVTAVEISRKALQTARLNAFTHRVGRAISWFRGSYFEALDMVFPRPCFDLVVSNPPYLKAGEVEKLPPGVKLFEPREALHGGRDGLDAYRSIICRLGDYARSGTLLLLEAGFDQQEQVEDICHDSGLFSSLTWHCDLSGRRRVLEGLVSKNS